MHNEALRDTRIKEVLDIDNTVKDSVQSVGSGSMTFRDGVATVEESIKLKVKEGYINEAQADKLRREAQAFMARAEIDNAILEGKSARALVNKRREHLNPRWAAEAIKRSEKKRPVNPAGLKVLSDPKRAVNLDTTIRIVDSYDKNSVEQVVAKGYRNLRRLYKNAQTNNLNSKVDSKQIIKERNKALAGIKDPALREIEKGNFNRFIAESNKLQANDPVAFRSMYVDPADVNPTSNKAATGRYFANAQIKGMAQVVKDFVFKGDGESAKRTLENFVTAAVGDNPDTIKLGLADHRASQVRAEIRAYLQKDDRELWMIMNPFLGGVTGMTASDAALYSKHSKTVNSVYTHFAADEGNEPGWLTWAMEPGLNLFRGVTGIKRGATELSYNFAVNKGYMGEADQEAAKKIALAKTISNPVFASSLADVDVVGTAAIVKSPVFVKMYRQHLDEYAKDFYNNGSFDSRDFDLYNGGVFLNLRDLNLDSPAESKKFSTFMYELTDNMKSVSDKFSGFMVEGLLQDEVTTDITTAWTPVPQISKAAWRNTAVFWKRNDDGDYQLFSKDRNDFDQRHVPVMFKKGLGKPSTRVVLKPWQFQNIMEQQSYDNIPFVERKETKASTKEAFKLLVDYIEDR